jgi:hypothetical protein
MDENEYNNIIKNIEKEKKYIVKEEILYRIKKDKLLRVIRRYEFEGLMYMMHHWSKSMLSDTYQVLTYW